MAGVLILGAISAVMNILLVKVLILKSEETAKYMGMYKAEARRCGRLERQNNELRIKLNRIGNTEG